MKNLILLILLCAFQFGYSQTLYKTSKASVSFKSEAPLEIIKAESPKLIGLINLEKSTFAFQVAPISFMGFNSELQREHFNENYMESTKYPKIKFSGKILDKDISKPGIHKVRIKGSLNLHGVEKPYEINALVTSSKDKFEISSRFDVRLEDHNIKIPKIVDEKIAEQISCEVQGSLGPK